MNRWISSDSEYEKQLDTINNFIREKQKEKDDTKQWNDKLECVVCGGTFTRKNKKIHDKTKKHTEKLTSIHEKYTSSF